MLFIASDHAGFHLKAQIINFLNKELKLQAIDCGPDLYQPEDNYNDYAKQVVHKVLNDKNNTSLGILICGTGTGMCIQANRFKGIRAVEAFSIRQAILAREHNNSNIICLGSQIIRLEENLKILAAWLGANFIESLKYQHRNDLLDE